VDEKFLHDLHGGDHEGAYNVSCLPMQDLIEATGLLDLDLFSLDVEGAELFVLQTIDFHITNIRAILIELDGLNAKKDDAVRALLTEVGFENAIHTIGNVRSRCRRRNCPSNEVWINPRWLERKKARRIKKVYYQYGTSVQCPPRNISSSSP